jgi:hypothetical protein
MTEGTEQRYFHRRKENEPFLFSTDYGGVEVEHMGPQYGPMGGAEMVYIVLKGRVLKNDLTITVRELTNLWTLSVDNFTKNGNVVYFYMPACPSPNSARVEAEIQIFYKQEDLYQSRYIYKGSLDRTSILII